MNTSATQPATGLAPGHRRWLPILLFVGMPWFLGLAHMLIRPVPKSEPALKAELMNHRGLIDTITVGDSRVLRIRETPFAKRGWVYFNMALTGMSPEDNALQLQYAMSRFPIKRVIMGVAFENMTQRFAFEKARYYNDPIFRGLPMNGLTGPAPRPKLRRNLINLVKDLLPVGQAGDTFRYYRNQWTHGLRPERDMLPDGCGEWVRIEYEIRNGTYDFAKNTDPNRYFLRDDHEARYLETKELSEDAKRLYSRMFQYLRERHIPCLVFETVRTPAYQKMIDENPLLADLQAQWRAFYRSESRGSVRFLDADSVRDCYNLRDFIDAEHFIGGSTEERLGTRLSENLAALEATQSKNAPVDAAGTKEPSK